MMMVNSFIGGFTSPPPSADPVYVGHFNNSGSTVTYANAPIGTATADRIVVVALCRTSLLGSSTTSVTVGGTGLTKDTTATAFISVADNQFLEIWYGVISSGTTADVVATHSSATGTDMFVYSVYGCSSTPLDHVAAASQTDTDVELNDIETKASGAVIALCDISNSGGAVSWSQSWSGTETVTEDFDSTGNTVNGRLMAAHFATTAATTTNDLTCTATASRAHCGVAISFGP